jgi:hypothetical protein
MGTAGTSDERVVAHGKGVWSWPPDAEAKPAVTTRGRREQSSPVPGESAL